MSGLKSEKLAIPLGVSIMVEECRIRGAQADKAEGSKNLPIASHARPTNARSRKRIIDDKRVQFDGFRIAPAAVGVEMSIYSVGSGRLLPGGLIGGYEMGNGYTDGGGCENGFENIPA
ncbi:hypothetical protein GQ457_01G053880 [Hibiscus cannabinus]